MEICYWNPLDLGSFHFWSLTYHLCTALAFSVCTYALLRTNIPLGKALTLIVA